MGPPDPMAGSALLERTRGHGVEELRVRLRKSNQAVDSTTSGDLTSWADEKIDTTKPVEELRDEGTAMHNE